MLRLRGAAAALTALLALASFASAQTPSPEPVPTASSAGVFRKTLANGLDVVVVEDHAAAVVQTGMWYRFGELLSTPGKTGLAHGLEHMMFRGTPAISSGGLDDIAARLGAEENANTSSDYTHFYFVMPSDKLDLALHIEADRMRNASLTEADWKLEKGAVLSEFDGDYSQPLFRLSQAVREKAYPNSPYAYTALGVRQDVVNSTAEDLRKYYDEWYHPNNATLVVAGDVQHDDVFARADKYFGPLPRKALPDQTIPSQPEDVHGATVTVDADYPYQVVDLAYYVPGDVQPDTAAPAVVASAISNDRSPFYAALVLSNLTLGYQAFTDTSLKGGLFHVYLTVAPGHTADEVRHAFETTLAQVRDAGISHDLVSAAKISVATQAIYARDSITGLGDRYGYADGVEQETDPDVDDAKVAALSDGDVNAALKRYLSEPAVVGTLVPQRPKPGAPASASGTSSVSDNFSSRAPNGPIVEAPWVKDALATPPKVGSKVDPTSFTLANGIRVFVQEIHTNPTVFVSGNIRQSPAFDPPAKTGTGTLASTLESFGSERYDFTAQRKISDDLGASIDVGSSFGVHGLARDLPTLLDVVADAEIHPTFPAQYVGLLKAQQTAAISQRRQDPDYLAHRAFEELLLPRSDPSLRETSKASIAAIGVGDLRAYAQHYFRPDLTTITVAGDVTPAQARAQLERTFGAWRAEGPKPNPALPPIPPAHPASRFVEAVRTSDTVRLGEPGITRRNPDFYALNVMNEILGGGGSFDTRLMDEIRVKRGLVYGVSSALSAGLYRGTINFSFSANPKNVRPALAVLKAQLRRIRTSNVSDEELVRAKARLVDGTLVGQQASDAIVEYIGNIAENRLPLDYYARINERYDPVTAADVLRVAKKYLHPDQLVEVYEGPRF